MTAGRGEAGRRRSGARLDEKRGLSRASAAEYIDVSTSLFDAMVADRRMPQPKKINSRLVWDRLKLDEAFSGLPDASDEIVANPADAAMDEYEARLAEARSAVSHRGRRPVG